MENRKKSEVYLVTASILFVLMILGSVQTSPVSADTYWLDWTSWTTETLQPNDGNPNGPDEWHQVIAKYYPPHYVALQWQKQVISPAGATVGGNIYWCAATKGESTWPYGGNVHENFYNPSYSYSVTFKFRYRLAYEYPFP